MAAEKEVPVELSLQSAINIAQERDEWLIKSKLTQRSFEELSQHANTLPDPTFTFGILNLPTDSFNIRQEPITQLKVGAAQLFPKGDTLALRQKKLEATANEQVYLRKDRLNALALQTTQLWLDTYEASASYHLVEETRPLFNKLSEIVSASYATSAGNTKQQDIIRAELELMRLKDRLVQLKSIERAAQATLLKFLLPSQAQQSDSLDVRHLVLPKTLPAIEPSELTAIQILEKSTVESLYPRISQHPLLSRIDKRISGASLETEIAEQAYKPQYGLNASYAYRLDDMSGNNRADLFSVGLSISMPLFSGEKVDADVRSSRFKTESIRTEKRLVARELIAELYQAYETYKGALERSEIYQNQILPQMSQQVDAAINAYTADTGDFAEVVRAKIAELDAKIILLNIEVSRRRALAQMHYILPLDDSQKESTHE